MTTREKLDALAAEKILVLDGAMGSMIQAYRSRDGKPLAEEDFRGELFAGHEKPLKGCGDVLCLSRPDVISGIHEAYLEAGADIIETCSLNATWIGLAEYGLGNFAREISVAAARVARQAADKFSTPEKPRFVAGSIGPTAKSASMTADMDNPGKRQITWDELEAAYYENVCGLVEGGVDLFLAETFYDSLNAKAALSAIRRVLAETKLDIPVMVSATFSESGRLITGQTPEAFCAAMLHAEPWALGLNCSFGAEKLRTPLEKIAAFAPCNVIFYPNAGLPDLHGQYDDTPEIMAVALEPFLKNRLVNVIGACCGSTPAHIAAIAEKAALYKPRPVPRSSRKIILAGTEIVEIGRGEKLPERACLSGEAAWQAALDQGDFEEAVEIAREEAEKGLNILRMQTDKAPDPVSAAKNFIFLAALFPEPARCPLLIESARWDVVEAGLKCLHGRGLVRFLGTLNPGQKEALRSFGAVLVDEDGRVL